MRRPRTEARPRRADYAKGLTNRGPLQKARYRRVGKGALCAAPTILAVSEMVGTRSLSSGAHSRDPLALPPYNPRIQLRRFRPHDRPADAQQWLPAVHHPFEG